MDHSELFQLIDRIVKCRKFKDAFLFDGIFSSEFRKNKFDCNALRLWILDHRYGALVNVRLHQMYAWKQLSCAERIREKLGDLKAWNKLNMIKRHWIVLKKPSLWKYYILNEVYLYLSIFFERLLMSVFRMSISPYADIDKGFWGGMRNIGMSAGTQVGKNSIFGPNVSLVAHKGGAPIIEDNVTIWAGAVVVGKVRVGTGAVIGANSVVIVDVPPSCTVLGNPARIIFRR